nr:solute carrier family 66 member 3 isoform X1 [Chrysemys picta bellii]
MRVGEAPAVVTAEQVTTLPFLLLQEGRGLGFTAAHCLWALVWGSIFPNSFSLQNLCTLISAASKFAQLRCLWQTRDSGQVSALTWSMSAYTCATRIVTTIMTTNDLMVLVRFIIMLVLNIWVTATILRYRKTEKTD